MCPQYRGSTRAEFLGWNLRWATGYSPDTAVMFQAVRQGEADLCATSNTFLLKPITEDGVDDMVAQSGIISGDRYIPRDSYKDVPVFPLLLRSNNLKPEEWQGYLSWAGSQQADRWMARLLARRRKSSKHTGRPWSGCQRILGLASWQGSSLAQISGTYPVRSLRR